MTEIRRRGQVSLPVLAVHFERSIDAEDFETLIHALRRAHLVDLTAEHRGDIVSLTSHGYQQLATAPGGLLSA